MSIDGIFIHYLINELEGKIRGGKINKIYQPTPLSIELNIRNNGENFKLLISSELNAPRMHLTTKKEEHPTPFRFCMLLRKYLERGIVTNISQYNNDRLIILDIKMANELGDSIALKLMVELMGRNSNIILVNEENVIIDAIRRLPPENNHRFIIPKALYNYPQKQKIINPFDNDLTDQEKFQQIDNLEGCSVLIKNEFHYFDSIDKILKQALKPTMISQKNKSFFYAFDLKHLDGVRTHFHTLSELLEASFLEERKSSSIDYNVIAKMLKKDLNRAQNKIVKLKQELSEAELELLNERCAILLQSNLYLVKQGMGSITVSDFFSNNLPLTIVLNPLLSPSDNLKKYFNKLKKAKSAISHLAVQIKNTENEISYLDTLLTQLQFANPHELQEIKLELRQNNYLKSDKNKKITFKKQITSYHLEDSLLFVGKNNLQNNYLTHSLAQKNDYWFHVKDAPGSHVVLRTNDLTDNLIITSAKIAAYYSKLHDSSSIPVDYTQIKYLKKIPGQKGSNVTYTNYKTIYVDLNDNLLKDLNKEKEHFKLN